MLSSRTRDSSTRFAKHYEVVLRRRAFDVEQKNGLVMAGSLANDSKTVTVPANSGGSFHIPHSGRSLTATSDWHYTVPYPREYVEYLEEQQEQLSSGLMTMYRLLKESHIITFPLLPEIPQAQDLLVALRGLKLDKPQLSHHQQHVHARGSTANFTNGESGALDHKIMQTRVLAASRSPTQPALFMPEFPSEASSESTDDPGSSSIPKSMPGSFMPLAYNPFDYAQAPQTSMYPQSQAPNFSPIQTTSPIYGQLLPNGAPSQSDTTFHNPYDASSGSPTHALHMSPHSTTATHRSSAGETNGFHNHDDQHIIRNGHPLFNQQWVWHGQADVSAGMYGNEDM